jgi:DNA-binding XRE family transcriptional regulator
MASRRSRDPPAIVSRSFAISDATFREVQEFVRQALTAARATSPRTTEIADAMARAAAEASKPVHLSIRVFADHVEVTAGADPAGDQRFREWFAEALKREGLSQDAAAKRLGVSLKTVNRWLRGHSEPRMRELRRVRQEFGQPPLS